MTTNHFKTTALFGFSIVLFSACHHSIPVTLKLQPTDPFKTTIVPSQYTGIDPKKDNMVEGDQGTVIVFPKGCFRNSKGDVVEDSVKVEISEAFTPADMLLSNLTTTSNGKPLETDGMIYVNATSNGEQLSIDKNNPIHVEIPTAHKRPGMMAYRGVRDSNGNMNWVEPKKIDNYLVPVNINDLDFLPDGFKAEVEKGLPFKRHMVATKELVDSLYYSLSKSDGSSLTNRLAATNYNEAYYNKHKQVVNGKYTDKSYEVGSDTAKHNFKDSSFHMQTRGIDPAIIKVIKSEKYQNTLIATREFQARLKAIFKTCDNSILEIYIQNLGKNMYELDSMAAAKLKGTDNHDVFEKFAQQRLTNVQNADKYASLLKGYYESQMQKVNVDLQKLQDKATKQLDKKNGEFKKIADDYKKVLQKRENYRMESYGFNWTQTGWINIDTGTVEKDWGMFPLEVNVDNGKQFDRVYTYVIYESIKSLYRLNSSDKQNFYAGNDMEKSMLMPKHQVAVCIAIGYKGDVPYLAVKEFETVDQTKLTITLQESTLDKVKEAINPFEKYGKENRISADLVYMQKMYQEEKRQQELAKESEFISRLWNVAHPCCERQKLLQGDWVMDSVMVESYGDQADSNKWVKASNAEENPEIWSFNNGNATLTFNLVSGQKKVITYSTNIRYWIGDKWGYWDEAKQQIGFSEGHTSALTFRPLQCGDYLMFLYRGSPDSIHYYIAQGEFGDNWGFSNYVIESLTEDRMQLVLSHMHWEEHILFHKRKAVMN